MAKLLSCPFCGAAPQLVITPDGYGHGSSDDRVAVSCQCGVSIGESDYTNHRVAERTASVVAKWNRRAR